MTFRQILLGCLKQEAKAAEAYKLWKNKDWDGLQSLMGSNSWPPNRGFVSIQNITLQPGQKIDRYGGFFSNGKFNDKGSFVSPAGNSFGSRALPADTIKKPYSVYEVQSPIDAKSGPAIPWFGQKGMGTQYELSDSIENLLSNGSIKRL